MLHKKINQYIHHHGYMTVDEYMTLCLYDPDDGYYKTKTCIGAQGDFITAPEISQLFGEIIAFWLINQWPHQPEILPRHLIELGPGRGTLMSDILRTLNKINPDYIYNLTIHLVETSPSLTQQQQQALSPFKNIKWYTALSELIPHLPQQYCYFIANEFFDALPIQQVQWHNQAWQQRVIQQCCNNNSLCWNYIPFQGVIPFKNHYPLPCEGDILEFSMHQLEYFNLICKHLSSGQNAALIIDYGYDFFGYGDTLQALRHHQYTDPLSNPGQCDLTTHINFTAFQQETLKYNLNSQLSTQAEFLKQYGIDQRLHKLLQANPNHTDIIQSGYHRLTDPQHMGDLFKVLMLK